MSNSDLDSHLYSTLGTPRLIQRCTLYKDKRGFHLQYDYMGSSDFEWGAPQAAMKALFEAGITRHEVTVTVDGREALLYVIARKGFSISEFTPILQALATDQPHLQEPSYLKERIQVMLRTASRPMGWSERINVWFDINNAVLIALTPKDARRLEIVLKDIQTAWANKA